MVKRNRAVSARVGLGVFGLDGRAIWSIIVPPCLPSTMRMPGMKLYNAFPGLYGLIFLNLEPLSTLIPAVATAFVPGGAAWFYNEQVPGGTFQAVEGPHTKMVLGQLVNGDLNCLFSSIDTCHLNIVIIPASEGELN